MSGRFCQGGGYCPDTILTCFTQKRLGPRFEDAVYHFGLSFATSAFISWLLFAVSRHLLTVILIMPGGIWGSTVIIRAQKFRIVLTTE